MKITIMKRLPPGPVRYPCHVCGTKTDLYAGLDWIIEVFLCEKHNTEPEITQILIHAGLMDPPVPLDPPASEHRPRIGYGRCSHRGYLH